MSRLYCSFPGRYGDLLWALPTCRAIAEAAGQPVDLVISEKYQSIAPLLRGQSYLGEVLIDQAWQVQETAPISPRISPTYPDALALGYASWPEPTLPDAIYAMADSWRVPLAPLDLRRPWLTVAGAPHDQVIAVGFTDEWFELKVGIMAVLSSTAAVQKPNLVFLAAPGSRWMREGGCAPLDWCEAATAIAGSRVFLGDCSALHVLAVALGTPCVIMEPNPQRHNPVFYPCGKLGPQVTLVLGNDGQPTFDARHVADVLRTRFATHASPTQGDVR